MNLLGRKFGYAFLCIFLSFSNTACSKEPMRIDVNLTAYNHTEHGIGSYIVTLEDGSSAEAGYLDPGQGGGGKTCCFSIPSVWRPGMKATIVMDTVKNGKDIRVEKRCRYRSMLGPMPVNSSYIFFTMEAIKCL